MSGGILSWCVSPFLNKQKPKTSALTISSVLYLLFPLWSVQQDNSLISFWSTGIPSEFLWLGKSQRRSTNSGLYTVRVLGIIWGPRAVLFVPVKICELCCVSVFDSQCMTEAMRYRWRSKTGTLERYSVCPHFQKLRPGWSGRVPKARTSPSLATQITNIAHKSCKLPVQAACVTAWKIFAIRSRGNPVCWNIKSASVIFHFKIALWASPQICFSRSVHEVDQYKSLLREIKVTNDIFLFLHGVTFRTWILCDRWTQVLSSSHRAPSLQGSLESWLQNVGNSESGSAVPGKYFMSPLSCVWLHQVGIKIVSWVNRKLKLQKLNPEGLELVQGSPKELSLKKRTQRSIASNPAGQHLWDVHIYMHSVWDTVFLPLFRHRDWSLLRHQIQEQIHGRIEFHCEIQNMRVLCLHWGGGGGGILILTDRKNFPPGENFVDTWHQFAALESFPLAIRLHHNVEGKSGVDCR